MEIAFTIIGAMTVLYCALRVGFYVIDRIIDAEDKIKEYEKTDRGDI